MGNDLTTSGELFHTATGTAFADLLVDGHRETWLIRGQRFKSWLRRSHYRATGMAASPATIRMELDLLEARAQFDGPERAVHVRVAEQAGHIYLDLADEHWRDRARRLAGDRAPAGALPPAPRDAAAADARAGRLD